MKQGMALLVRGVELEMVSLQMALVLRLIMIVYAPSGSSIINLLHSKSRIHHGVAKLLMMFALALPHITSCQALPTTKRHLGGWELAPSRTSP